MSPDTAMQDAWAGVMAHAKRLQGRHLRALFEDGGRFGAFSARLDDLLLDYSKEKLDAEALEALFELAAAADIEGKRAALFGGAHMNNTEDRAALHMAARAPGKAFDAPGAEEIEATLARFLSFAEDVRSGAAATSDGQPFRDVISIGIGGSDLGPVMATRALAPYADGPRLHYVSNVDGAHFADVSKGLDPARTLVIVQSKTFTTQETMTNAQSAKDWLEAALGDDIGAHLAAVSTNLDATRAFGADDSRVFGFWDWIGGRYSIWSAIGLPLAMAIGAENFRAFLAGGAAMDDHFQSADMRANLPVLMGLIGVWRRNGLGYGSTAIIPYDERLSRFPAYLQQLTMESNGKRVTRDGAPAPKTCPVVWGEPGTNAQHSFFQLLHQGTDIIPVDFLLAAQPHETLADHHAKLAANCLAQSKALAFGKTEEEALADMADLPEAQAKALAPHRAFPGDRPSSTLLYRRLDPFTLGRLIALYEHKTFVEAMIWDINPFDQWGVELGKALAKSLLPMVKGADSADEDVSTGGLLRQFHALRSTA